jgi:predicted Zn-ribbon and HTH transcriptional regulator
MLSVSRNEKKSYIIGPKMCCECGFVFDGLTLKDRE